MTLPRATGTEPVAERPALRRGDRLGRFAVIELLGRGGMGIVYRAEADGKDVALKAVHPHLVARREFLTRFRLEAEAGARVRHPNVLRTHGVETVETPYGPVHLLVMEYVRGKSLQDLQTAVGRVPEAALRDLGAQVAAGLAAIHEAGVIHRDLKPENILVTEANEVKVMDLGVARLARDELHLSRTGQFVGSLLFAAPEQLADKGGVGPAADLYALGLVLFLLASGRHAFPCETVGEIVSAHLSELPPRLSSVVPTASPFLDAVVATLLEKDPAKRFSSARALKEALEAGEASEWWRTRQATAGSAPGAPAPLRRTPFSGDPAPRDAGPEVAGEGPILGRGRELRDLAESWGRARGGHGGAALLVGEEGVGRSRLLRAFLDAAGLSREDALVVRGPGAGSDGPLGGFRAAVAAVLPKDASLDAAVARRIAGGAGPAGLLVRLLRDTGAVPLAAEATSVAAALVDLVAALSRERPRVVAVDDLDLLSEEDRRLFRALAAVAHEHPLLLVATATTPLDPAWREDLLGARGLHEVPIGRLDADAMRGFLRHLLRSVETADAISSDLLARAGGTPQVLERLVAGLVASGSLVREADGTLRLAKGGPPADLPADVRGLVDRRLSSLTPGEREALDGACVQGRSFDALVTASALGRTPTSVLADLAALSGEPRLVCGEGRVRRFDPAVVQEVVWSGLDPARRLTLHRRTAEAFAAAGAAGDLPRERSLPRVALHHLLGGDAAAASKALVPALDALLASRRVEEALELTRLALAASSGVPPDVRIETLLRRARLLDLLGRRDEERQCLEAALAASAAAKRGAPPAALDAYGRSLVALGETRRAEEVFREQLAAAEAASDFAAQAAAHGVLARLAAAAGDAAGARAHAETALRLARASGQRMLETRALGLLAAAFEREGDADLAQAHEARRLSLATRAGDALETAQAHDGLARIAMRRGRWREAQVHLDRESAIAREVGHREAEARARIGLGCLALARGRNEAALVAFEEARRAARAAEAPVEEAEADLHIARAALSSGDAAGALARTMRALSVATRTHDRRLAALCCLAGGAEAEARGDADEAAGWYKDAFGHAGDGRGWLQAQARLGLARAARRLGQPDRMAEPLTRVEHEASRRGWPGPLVVAAALRASAPGGDAARAVALLALHGERLSVDERAEAHEALHAATGDAWHEAAAKEARDVARGLPRVRRTTLADGGAA